MKRILEQLETAGHQAYAVGGCVRDSLLERVPEDWDITTSALPEEVKALFRRTIDTGIQHGTVTVLMPDPDKSSGFEGYEVTTYRIDGEYKDGRHPDKVIFTPSLHEDLARRDFTINAMAVNAGGDLVDDFSGLEDLEKKVIRAVGNAEHRFEEDALRMLRALRFSAQLGFCIEESTRQAVCKLSERIRHVSKERIAVELTKLLMSDRPWMIEAVFETGLAKYLTEEFCGIHYEHRMPDGLPRKKGVRWGIFLRNDPCMVRTVLRKLKMDNETINEAENIAGLFQKELPADAEGNPDAYRTRKLLSEYGFVLYSDYLDARKCVSSGTKDIAVTDAVRSLVEKIIADKDCITLKELAISGGDLMSYGIPRGPEIGRVLNLLLDDVLHDPEHNKKEYLSRLLS